MRACETGSGTAAAPPCPGFRWLGTSMSGSVQRGQEIQRPSPVNALIKNNSVFRTGQEQALERGLVGSSQARPNPKDSRQIFAAAIRKSADEGDLLPAGSATRQIVNIGHSNRDCRRRSAQRILVMKLTPVLRHSVWRIERWLASRGCGAHHKRCDADAARPVRAVGHPDRGGRLASEDQDVAPSDVDVRDWPSADAGNVRFRTVQFGDRRHIRSWRET
jgi:hypothetical protein